MAHRGAIALRGRSIIQRWEPGALEYYHLRRGYELAVAKSIMLAEGLRVGEPNVALNMIVNDGLELVLDLLIDQVDAGSSIQAIGTDNTTPAAGDTALGSEAARKQWTTRSRTNQQADFSVFYLAAESSYAIEECGMFGGPAADAGTPDSGTLFAHWLQSEDNSTGSVDLTFDYALIAQEGS